MDRPLVCPHCNSRQVSRNGTYKPSGAQKVFCRDCTCHWQLAYSYKGCASGIDRQIRRLTLEGMSVRQIAKKLSISTSTVQAKRLSLPVELRRGKANARSKLGDAFVSKSPLRYPGGKAKVLDCLLPLFPSDVAELREPFVGGGSVFLSFIAMYQGLRRCWINDLNPDVASFWHVLKEMPNRLVDLVWEFKTNFPDGRKLYQHLMWNYPAGDELSRAVRFFIINRITFSGVMDAGGYSANAFQHRFTMTSLQKLQDAAAFLRPVRVSQGDYEPLLSSAGERVFLFLDPPYYSATDSKLYGEGGVLHTAFDHERFAFDLKRCPHRWLLTYDDDPDIRRLFAFARIQPWHVQYGMNNVNKQSQALKGKELLIRNY